MTAIRIGYLNAYVDYDPASQVLSNGDISVTTILDGHTKIIYVSTHAAPPPRRLSEKNLSLPSSSLIQTNENSGVVTSVTDILVSAGWKIAMSVHVEEVCMSVVDATPQEVLFATFSDLHLELHDDSSLQSVTFSIQDIQVDNQLYHRFNC